MYLLPAIDDDASSFMYLRLEEVTINTTTHFINQPNNCRTVDA
jgi:hypothetical protein